MNSASKVDELVEQWKRNGITKTELVIKTAEAELGWPYVWGAVGAQCTPEKRKYYAERSICPENEKKVIISGCQALNGSGKYCGGCQYYPNNMRTLIDDCQGFVKQVLSRVGVKMQGGGCPSMYNNNANWIEKGPIENMPKDKVCCVFIYVKSKNNYSHVGLYIGNGQVIHCSKYVRQGPCPDKSWGWSHYAIPKGLDGIMPYSDKPTLKKGAKGEYVTLLQTKLIQLGYSCGTKGADGIFGNATLSAVKQFQLDNGLQMDGIVGAATWAALDNPEKPEYYTVTIPGLPKYEAEAIVKQYKNASMKKE